MPSNALHDSSQPKPPDAGTAARKADHIRINAECDVSAKGVTNGFEGYAFVHQAFPEIDLAEVDTGTQFLGRRLAAPLLVSCMTGGTAEAARINRTLARVAQAHGFALGLGSGRIALERPETLETFDVRAIAPDVAILANLGAVQLNKGYGAADCSRLVESLHADALVLHVNPLQEALQIEGDTNFRGLLEKVARLCASVEFPVIVKEVGWGIAPATARALFDAGVAAVDVAGAGGTSWSEVERYRVEEPWRARVAAEFAGWGIPTATCVREARSVAPDGTLVASGGISNGVEIAKAIALGADLAGVAGPFLRAATRGDEPAHDLARQLVETLRVAMFSIGARTLADLRDTPHLVPSWC
jgi:isopentenyl-diphosphate delta-isomerase